MKLLVLYFCLGLVAADQACGQGFVLWNESVNGPLGNSPGNATSLTPLILGTNSIWGMAELEPTGPNWFVHEDYFRFSITPGLRLNEIFFTIDKPNVVTWLGPSDFNSTIGYTPNSTSGRLLSQFGIQMIESGSYGMYIANHNFQPVISIANYRFDFVVAAVPEPSIGALLALGSGLFWCAARRRRK